MAACASLSDADEALRATDEKENFLRLARLLMCGGVTLLREVFDTIHPPANLPVKLNDPATKTQLKGAKLTKPEWDCVYPSYGVGQSTDFDITLLFRLLRTICGLTTPVTGWNNLPNPTDHSHEADFVRIKFYRNSVYGHNHTMEITDSDFANLWREISEALLRIAGTISTAKRDEWKESINKLLHDPLTPDAARYVAELQSWCKKDMDTKDEVEKWGNTIMEQLMKDKQEVITILNNKLQELTIKHNHEMQELMKQNRELQEQTNILIKHVISIHIAIASIKPGGSSITQSQFPNTPLVQHLGRQSESVCIPGPIPPEQPQTEGAVGMSSSWELQQNDPTDPKIWEAIVSSCNVPLLFENLRVMFGVDVQSSSLGSLVITVSCSSLEVLEGLWTDHCTGHLNEMVQETLVTAEVLQELCLSELKLKTIISEKEYKACKELFTQGNENLQQLTKETPSATTTSTSDNSDNSDDSDDSFSIDDSDENESLEIQEEEEASSQGAVVVPTSLDNRPISDTVLHDIGSGLGTSWKELGRCLGIREKDLKAIDMKEHDKEERKGISMLNMWRETQGEYATRVVLQEALEEIGSTDLSQKGHERRKFPFRLEAATRAAEAAAYGETKTKMPQRPAAAMAAEPATYGETKTKMPHRPEVATAAEFPTGIFAVALTKFEAWMMYISNQLTSDDLEKMTFVLQDVLPKGKLEGVQEPYELFSLMMETKLLSAKNLTRLVELLEVVGRVDLSKYLLMLLEAKGETKTKMPHRPAAAIAAEPAAYGHERWKFPFRLQAATGATKAAAYKQTYVKHSETPKGENYIAESGYVMTINNYSFLQRTHEEKYVEYHIMTPLDNLKQLFQLKFGFRLGEHENLTKSEMLKELTHTAEKDFSTHDCFVCVIQSEGSKGGIFGTDDEVIKPETITSLFSRDKCPSLDGKPKIFLIQALKRQHTYKGPGSVLPPRPVISEDDFLIWYAHPIYDPRSFFETHLEYLADTLSGRDTSSRDLMEILMEVNKDIAKFSFRFLPPLLPPLPPPYLVSTLTKKVFLKSK